MTTLGMNGGRCSEQGVICQKRVETDCDPVHRSHRLQSRGWSAAAVQARETSMNDRLPTSGTPREARRAGSSPHLLALPHIRIRVASGQAASGNHVMNLIQIKSAGLSSAPVDHFDLHDHYVSVRFVCEPSFSGSISDQQYQRSMISD